MYLWVVVAGSSHCPQQGTPSHHVHASQQEPMGDTELMRAANRAFQTVGRSTIKTIKHTSSGKAVNERINKCLHLHLKRP